VLPNVLIIGAMKAGTSSLHRYLQKHPRIFMSEVKELHYFTEELNWKLGREWYEEQFAAADGAEVVGESSTSYAKFPHHNGVPRRIADSLPEVKLIYLIRHPVERIRSQYLHQEVMGQEELPFEEAVAGNPYYFDLSRYAFQLDQYLEFFARDQILILESEDLRRDRERTIGEILRFLGLEEDWKDPVIEEEFHRTSEKRSVRPPFQTLHRFAPYRTLARVVPEPLKRATFALRTRGTVPDKALISDSLRRHLESLLREDVKRLRLLIGEDFHGWGIA
jgi:hypothetical protein